MDAGRVRSLIAAAFPELADAPVSRFAEGWVNELWRVGPVGAGGAVRTGRPDLLFRFPKRAASAAGVGREMALLKMIGPALPTPVPDYRYVAPAGALDYAWPFGGYPLIPGVPLAELPPGPGPANAALAAAVGRFLTDLHRFPVARVAGIGVPGGSPEAWHRSYDEWHGTMRDVIRPFLAPEELNRVDSRMTGFLADDGHFAFTPVLLHRDLGADHLLVDPQTLGLTGVIDFEDAAVGDPAFDFTGLAGLGPGALDNYKGPSDAGFAERIEFYRRLVPLHELLYGIEEGLPERVAGGLLRLRRDLAGPA